MKGGMDASSERICRICLCSENVLGFTELISPCACKGSMKYVHSYCLKSWWYRDSFSPRCARCEQCLESYNVGSISLKARITVHLATCSVFVLIYAIVYILLYPIIDGIYFISNADYEVQDARYSVLPYVTLFIVLGTAIVGDRLLYLFNFLFTFWRVLEFDFAIDRFVYGVFASIFVSKIYAWLYSHMDRYYFILFVK